MREMPDLHLDPIGRARRIGRVPVVETARAPRTSGIHQRSTPGGAAVHQPTSAAFSGWPVKVRPGHGASSVRRLRRCRIGYQSPHQREASSSSGRSAKAGRSVARRRQSVRAGTRRHRHRTEVEQIDHVGVGSPAGVHPGRVGGDLRQRRVPGVTGSTIASTPMNSARVCAVSAASRVRAPGNNVHRRGLRAASTICRTAGSSAARRVRAAARTRRAARQRSARCTAAGGGQHGSTSTCTTG